MRLLNRQEKGEGEDPHEKREGKKKKEKKTKETINDRPGPAY